MRHAVHHLESGQESASHQEAKVAKEKMRNPSLARLSPVQVCTIMFLYEFMVLPSLAPHAPCFYRVSV